jgi:acyl carrier protein
VSGDGTDIESRVLAILSTHVRNGVVPAAETDIISDTGMDSVAVMDFVLDVEEAFDITLPLDRLTDVRTAADVTRTVSGILTEDAR